MAGGQHRVGDNYKSSGVVAKQDINILEIISMVLKTIRPTTILLGTKLLIGIFMVTAMVAGCGPHGNKKKPSSNSIPAPAATFQNEVSYQAQLGGDGKEAPRVGPVAGKVTLMKKDANVGLEASSPLVLDSTVPDEILLQVTLQESEIPANTTMQIQGQVLKSERVVQRLPEAAFVSADIAGMGKKIAFFLKGLRSLVSDNESERVSVVLSVSSKDKNGEEIKRVFFDLRSPPSKVSSKLYVPASLYEQEKQITIPASSKSLYLPNGERQQLIGVIELRNLEDQGYEVRVPLVLRHDLHLVNELKSVSAWDCGHSTQQADTRAALDSSLKLLALGHNVEKIIDSARPNGEYTVFVRSQDVVQIGIYTSRPDGLVAPIDAVNYQQVPIRCVAHCTSGGEGDWADEGKWGGSCVACGRIPGNSGTPCYDCMRTRPGWCRWQHWNQWKDYTQVAVGSAFHLEIIPEVDGVSSEFGLAYRPQQVVPRKFRVLSEKIFIDK